MDARIQAEIDQAAAHIRDGLDLLNVSCADPEHIRALNAAIVLFSVDPTNTEWTIVALSRAIGRS